MNRRLFPLFCALALALTGLTACGGAPEDSETEVGFGPEGLSDLEDMFQGTEFGMEDFQNLKDHNHLM